MKSEHRRVGRVAGLCVSLLAGGLVSGLGVGLLGGLAGCAGPRVERNSATAWTPARYVEHRVLFARPSAGDENVWDLKYGYQARTAEDEKLAIRAGDPISIVVSDVYLPRDFAGTRDVVVLLDVYASSQRQTESYAVWYQRGVRGGQKLGFDSLLVYSDQAWSPIDPPRFTLRVIDVTTERNEEARQALEGLNSAVGGLGAFIPNPIAAGAATALRVAGQVLSNRQNTSIIDFTPQFYSPDFVQQAGPNDLPLFMQGMWLVVGRAPAGTPLNPVDQPAENFWLHELQLDRRTGLIYSKDDPGTPSGCPYVRMTIAAVDSAVPKAVLEHSDAIFTLLTQANPSQDMITAVSKELLSSLTAFGIHKNFLAQRSKGSLEQVFKNLATDTINDSDRAFLLRVASRVSGQSFSNAADADAWWASNRESGDVDATTGRWVKSGS